MSEQQNDQDFFERIANLLNQQREMYGDFEVPRSSSEAAGTEKVVEQVHTDEPTEVSEESSDYEVTESVKELTESEKIAACSTLEELKSVCEQSEVLKTDLPNTNLVFGVGAPAADLMIIGEAPGENEDKQGEPFVGAAGQLLDKILSAINFKRSEVYIANILKHRPPGNRDPKPEERERSLPYLLKQIDIVDPKIILCVGRISATTLLGEDRSLKSMRQRIHKFHDRELMVTYHPAALLRNSQWKRPTWEDVQLLRKRYDQLSNS